MHFKTVTYKRIKNLGNYESATIEVSVEMSPYEDPKMVARAVIDNVECMLGVGPYKEKDAETNELNPESF
jgi:hypothetical protein